MSRISFLYEARLLPPLFGDRRFCSLGLSGNPRAMLLIPPNSAQKITHCP